MSVATHKSRPIRMLLIAVGIVLASGLPAVAGLVFYDNTPAAFNAAAAAFAFLGTENFEEPTPAALPNNSAAVFAPPLSPTSTTAPYTSGITLPLTVRTVDPVSGTPEDLVAFRNHLTVASTVVLANTAVDTLDWVFLTSSDIIAVGLNPVTFSGSNVTRRMTVDVFDTSNVSLGTITVDANDAGSRHLGLVASGASRIGRINLYGFNASGGGNVSEGADNAALYSQAVPEPATLLVVAVSLAMLIAAWRSLRRS